MRKIFELNVDALGKKVTKKKLKELYPWAEVIVPVDCGWLCFESQNDYNQWRKNI